jgi:hypothetical protein
VSDVAQDDAPSAAPVAQDDEKPSAAPAAEPSAAEPVTEVIEVADETAAAEPASAPTFAELPATDEPATEVLDAVVWDEPTTVDLVPVDGAPTPAAEPDVDEHTDPSGVVATAESFLTWPPTEAVPAPAPAPTPTGGPVPLAGASLDDHDGLTILSTDLAEIREQLPSWASDEVPGPFRVPAAVQTAARLVLSTGLVVPLDRAVLLGRAPQVARVTNRELPRLITVPSPQQDISRTHAEVRVEGDHVVVTDLDSTNGVHVARPGEGARRLHPGEPSVVGLDEIVDLGDGVTFSVERGS